MHARSIALQLALMFLVWPAMPADAGFTVMGYDREIIGRQYRECPPRGPYPDEGCDQCLAINHDPLIPLFQIFCGPDRRCRLPGDYCPECNGTCIAIWHAGYTKWFVVWGDADPVRDVITSCNQWLHQSYCSGVTGGYFVGESFGWLPFRQRSYQNLHLDSGYRNVLAGYNGPGAFWLGDGWRYRIGLFAEMARRAPPGSSDQAHYARAANLAAWYYIAAYGDNPRTTLAMIGYPDDIGDFEYRDLTDIHEVTCSSFPFLDCTDAVDASTWGAIKQRFLER